MKPINAIERNQAIKKYIGMAVGVLAIFGFAVSSFSNIGSSIHKSHTQDKVESKALVEVLDNANVLLEQFDKADSDTDRSEINLKVNKLFLENRENFVQNIALYDKVEDLTKRLVKKQETIISGDKNKQMENLQLTGAKNMELVQAQTSLKQVENELNQLKSKTQQTYGIVRNALDRHANSLTSLGADIQKTDWCPRLGGSGRKSEKNRFEQKLQSLRNEILNVKLSLN